jgi:hypothetical protein
VRGIFYQRQRHIKKARKNLKRLLAAGMDDAKWEQQ